MKKKTMPLIFRPMLLLAAMPVVLLAACATPPTRDTAAAGISSSCIHAHPAGEAEIGYCQARRVGNTLYLSGIVGQGPMPEAIAQVYGGLQRSLAANGLDFRHVVKETVFATDLDAFIRHKQLRKDYYAGHLPAASWVQVARLFQPAYVLEVELIAQFPQP